MAKRRYDVCIAEKTQEKTYWKKIGVVLQSDKGFSLKVEMIPVGWDGWASLFEPKEKDSAPAKSTRASDDDGGIPF